MRIASTVVVVWSLILGLVAGCASPGASQVYAIGVSNGTTLTVAIVVNGRTVRTLAPGSGTTADGIPASELGPLPWSVEARSPSGRLLTTMTVHDGDVFATAMPGGGGTSRGDGARVDLSCGRLDIWVGPPLLGPVPGTGSPGDCEP